MGDSNIVEMLPEPTPAQRRSVWRRWAKRTCWLIGSIVFLGLLLRVTLRDSLPALNILYYGTPLPLLALGSFCCFLLNCFLKQLRISALWLVLLLGLLTVWIRQDWKMASGQRTFKTATFDELNVLFWNVARRDDLTTTVAEIRRWNPEIVALVEVTGKVRERKQFWKEQLPEYEVSALGGMMYLIAKGTSGETIAHNLGGNSHARQLKVHLKGQDYQFLVVDIDANLLRPRREPLQKLASVCENLTDESLIVLGDFNTPPDSVWFETLRKNQVLAFEKVGAGYAPTWPVPVPILQLDQIWLNQNVIPLACHHGWSWNSDHRPVTVRIRPAR